MSPLRFAHIYVYVLGIFERRCLVLTAELRGPKVDAGMYY